MSNLFTRLTSKLLGRPSKAHLQAQYWDARYSTDDFVWTLKPNMFVMEFCEKFVPGKVLDVAGGEGRNALWFAERGWQAENIDFSQVGLDKWQKVAAEKGFADRAFSTCASATDFKAKLAPADLGVIAYLQVERKIIDEAIENTVSQLKPGATLFGVWHARENLKDGFGGPQDPDVLPTAAELKETCAKLGLNVLVCENRDGLVQTKDGYKPSIVVVLEALVPSK